MSCYGSRSSAQRCSDLPAIMLFMTPVFPFNTPTRLRLTSKRQSVNFHLAVYSNSISSGTHAPYDETPKCPGQPETEHGETQTTDADEEHRLPSNMIGDPRPLENEHGFRGEEYRLLQRASGQARTYDDENSVLSAQSDKGSRD